MVDKSKLQKNLRNKLNKNSQIPRVAASSAEQTEPVKRATRSVETPIINTKPPKPNKSKKGLTNIFESKKPKKPLVNKQAKAANHETIMSQLDEMPPRASQVPQIPKVKPAKIKKAANTKSISDYLPLTCWYSTALLIVLLDQITKSIASAELIGNPALIITSWLEFNLVYNPGAAFSMFANFDGWQRPFLVAVSLFVSIYLVIWIARLDKGLKLLPLSITFILGGAVGNLIDRALMGKVVDFISVHYEQLYFPSFNIADAAISIGAVLLFADMIFNGSVPKISKKETQQTPASQPNNRVNKELDVNLTVDELLRRADEKKANTSSKP